MKAQTNTRASCCHFLAAAVMVWTGLVVGSPASGAVIGVLSDERQVEYLSLLGASSAEARLALEQDGHSINTLTSLELLLLELVDIVWLPLLDSAESYTTQERLNILQYVLDGGRVIWIGDADVYNTGDDSFLTIFGMSKLAGNLNPGLQPVPEAADQPVVTGPHGAVAMVATDAGYGLFTSIAEVVDVFVGVNEEGPPETGTFAGFMDPTTGFTGSGRVAFICDASIFGQGLDQPGQDHRAFLRNVVKWAEAAPGYTPSGTDVSTGELPSACGACNTVQLVFETVSATGETTAAPIGAGRCGFDGVAQASLPLDFLGYGFDVSTTATFPDPTDIDVIVTYDEAELASLGIDETALQLFWYDPNPGIMVEITTVLDVTTNTITGTAADVGAFLLGAIVGTEDCNANAVPDECDIDPADPDGDGLVSADCNSNGEPDECEIDQGSGAPGGPFFCQSDCDPDCNNNGIPDACDIAGGQSADCNGNGVPDECEAGTTPEITQQPVDQTACDGGAVTFTVVADGPPPLNYQWRKNGDDIPGATGSTVTIDPVASIDAGGYDVTVTNACDAVTSDVAALTVSVGPTMTEQPSDQDACEGDPVVFTAAATGTGAMSYQWKRDGEALFDGGSVTGTATPTLQLDPVNTNHAGAYTCEVTDTCGSLESDPATLNVGLLLEVTQGPAPQSVCPGGTATFSVSASGTGLTLQWQYDDGGGFQGLTDDGDISGSATETLTIANVTPVAAGLYRCSVDGDCGVPVTTDAALLAVKDVVQITSEPEDRTACPGDGVSFAVSTSGTNPVYQWRFDDGGGFQALEDGGGISGADTDTLMIADVSAVHQGAYHCFVHGDCGVPVTSQSATLTVFAFPEITAEPSDEWACPGEAVVFYVAAIGSGLTYQWQFDGGGGFVDLADGGDIGGATTPTLTISNATQGAAGPYHCVASGNCGTPVTSATVALTIGTEVEIESHPADDSTCTGAQVVFEVIATGSGLTYQWRVDTGQGFGDVIDGGGISGATTSALTLSGVGEEDAGLYHCIVFGTCSLPVTSNSATLAVTFGACDCNNNGQPDADDIAGGTSQDCNNNAIPDECDIDLADPDGNGLVSEDCNSNGKPDECEIDENSSAPGGPFFCQTDCEPDCNDNGVPDSCDTAAGTSQDCNNDGVLDECQLDGNDCNGNGVPDECDPPYVADAGDPFTICTGQVSLPLGGNPVASGSTPPYTFSWSVIAGPEGGGTLLGSTDERPGFVAAVEGVYEIEVVVSDSSQPPCVATDTVLATATSMSVDAGVPFVMCVGATSAALSPTVTGGVEPYTYLWTVDEGSPSTSLDQFTGGGPQSEGPTFAPDAPGEYTLRLTVLDANTPACMATAALEVLAAQLTVELGDDFAMCVSGESLPLDVAVLSSGAEPLLYAWTIDETSPDTAPSQFTGSGPNSQNPTFSPTAVGAYILHVAVQDSSTPPCEQTRTLYVSVGSLTVDAGGEQTVCVGPGGIRLSPMVEGGFGNLLYSWSIEPGSPSVAPDQFTDPHQFGVTPLFVPSSLGNYTLRLTVTDSGTPPCTASDTLVVRATTMTVDAGEDFVTRAFQPSRQLGAIPVAGGGDPPITYDWEILGGPSRDPAQFSAAHVEHPFFTPSTVGTYEIRVNVRDANGDNCAVSDVLLVEAITPTMTLPVNVEGRLFMTLQIDAPYTRGEVRIFEGLPGAQTSGNLHDDGPAAHFDGLVPTPNLTRRMTVESELVPGSFQAVIVMFYDDGEIGDLDERELQLHRLNTQLQFWRLAGVGVVELGPFPVLPSYSDLGRHGIDLERNCAWAVVDYLGEFAIGKPSGETPEMPEPPAAPPEPPVAPPEPPPAEDDTPEPSIHDSPAADPEESVDLAPTNQPAPLCGAVSPVSAGATLSVMLSCLVGASRRRRR